MDNYCLHKHIMYVFWYYNIHHITFCKAVLQLILPAGVFDVTLMLGALSILVETSDVASLVAPSSTEFWLLNQNDFSP